MPFPKPQSALLFNNYYDYNSKKGKISSAVDQDDINLIFIAAGIYHLFGTPKAGKNLNLLELGLIKLIDQNKFKSIFQLEGPEGSQAHILFNVYRENLKNFYEIKAESMINLSFSSNLGALIPQVGNSLVKESLYEGTLTIDKYLIALLDYIFKTSDNSETLGIPFVKGETKGALIPQEDKKTGQGIPIGEIGDLPGQVDLSIDVGDAKQLKQIEGIDVGKIIKATGESAGAGGGFNPME